MSKFNETQKAFIDNQPKMGNKFIMDLQYEPLYEYIKTDRQYIWDQYYESIKIMIYNLVSKYFISFDDLIGNAWIYFNKGLDKYNPYYNGNFYPLKNYLLGYMYNTFRGNIQYEFIRKKREMLEININSSTSAKKDSYKPEIIENNGAIYDDYKYNDDLLEILDLFPLQYKQAILLLLQGKKQDEIANMLNSSQSRISIMWRTIRKIVKGERTNNNLKIATMELYNFCHDYSK